MACNTIQKNAAEVAVNHTEQQLRDAITARKTHRERTGGKGQPFYDLNFVGSAGYAIVSTLPEMLRPKMGGVTAVQMQLYEDFLVAPPALSAISPQVSQTSVGAVPPPTSSPIVAGTLG